MARPTKNPEDRAVSITLSVPPRLLALVREKCAQEHVGLSAFVTRALERELEVRKASESVVREIIARLAEFD